MDNTKNTNQADRLFGEFPPVTTAEWEARIQEDLKGADYEKKLIWKTAEGFAVKPYYRSGDMEGLASFGDALPGQFPYLRGNKADGNKWRICQDIETANPANANALAREVIAKGADALSLNAGNIDNTASLKTLLEGIDTGKISLNFNSAKSYPALAGMLVQHLGEAAGKTCGSFDCDPLSYVLLKGNYHTSREKDLGEVTELVENYGDKLPHFRLITINGHYFHNSGATLTQELAFALASGNEYMALLTSAGIPAGKAAESMIFVFATGGNYFMEIAKLRAARLLWARIVEQYQPASPESAKMRIHSVTANWNKTIYDPYVNMLRTTTEAMSAALGGADMITVLPFDLNYKEPDGFSMRMARNQQIILKEESSLDKVVDPAAGSYYIENLTASLADAAWRLFLEVEEKGGMTEAVQSGFIQNSVAASAAQKNAEIAARRTVMLGTNQYPNMTENMLDKIQTDEEEEDAEITDPVPVYKTMEPYRGADAFEDLRLATEIYESEEGHRPHVFLLATGNLAMRKARAGFSTNFFGCAGYKVTDNAGFNTVDEGVKAALEAKADIVVLCSSDEEYADIAPTAARALKAARPEIQVVVAGFPKELVEQLKAAGVDEFIHVRTNVLETLYAFQQKLGVML
ncbi:MAG: methylmalonyl-CoA mutase family protein [Lentimicrobium sp.]|uniref:methylmalonyl-CoA mutase family protein n=1 Tax=Lentimicrobium sp. TaxID=2034841 RepID=UPI0025D262E5|nr:methylmalonyl-CoA mutase family protein [Lentimicrobium sp.]MCO5255829.1 methylmalonyl-CoA mutase family protein [Lentimicrobium sp.]